MRGLSYYGWGALSVLALYASGSSCAEGTVEFSVGGSDSVATSGAGAHGGSGGAGGGSSVCAEDCSAITTPPCLKSVCNEGRYQGTIGECVIVPDAGASCEDGEFCTIDDTCDETGQCIGGPANDCGMTPGPCKEIACDEDVDSCTEIPSMPGAPCQDPANLCLKGSTCNNGLCTGGTIDDCFFFPVSDDCHVATCNPANGMCEEQVGNEGGQCTDTTALCTVGKTCAGGICQGGMPKDCSAFTVGCNIGVCEPTTGQCMGMPVMNGDPCDDLNGCTTGELCNNGQCTGGMLITQCISNDGCCPPSCTQATDADCNCNINLALNATAAVNPGGGSTPPYDPPVMNNGNGENCNEWAWVSNSTTSPGWATLTWGGVVTVGSMFIDSEHATMASCGAAGRDIASAEVQYMDVNNAWVPITNISGNENYMVTLSAPVQAKAVRLWNVFSSAGNGNTIIHEWYVWPGSSCPTPTPN